MKRAQQTLEFFTDFGWAFLVVLVVVAVIAVMYNSRSNSKPDLCLFSLNTPCVDKAIMDSSDDRIRIALKNNFGRQIRVLDKIEVLELCMGAEDLVAINGAEPPQIVNNGENMILDISCPGLGSGVQETDLVLYFASTETNMEHTITGKISGTAS